MFSDCGQMMEIFERIQENRQAELSGVHLIMSLSLGNSDPA